MTTDNNTIAPIEDAANFRALVAARHLCQEARVVLTSLRGGPPNVARGDLAQDLTDVRGLIKRALTHPVPPPPPPPNVVTPPPPTPTYDNPITSPTTNDIITEHSEEEDESGCVLVQHEASPTNAQSVPRPPQPPTTTQDVGPFARPFLSVVMDPRAAGPHTLVALRALHRLLERSSLTCPGSPSVQQHFFTVALEPLTKGVLSCKFEQTDAGADEAVEMAIADLLAFLVRIDRRAIHTETLMDAFNTVFITRNTFVHSPALCYHFEDVLTSMVVSVFDDLDDLRDPTARLMFEFLVNQLLHTPLVGGDDEASRDAQIAHDATRVLCLRLTRCALRHGFSKESSEELLVAATSSSSVEATEGDRTLLHIIQDDLCLSLLMTGQAIWAYQDNSNISPGFISLEVLSEICATLSTLWNTVTLRKHLVPQFGAIFTGFYQRALVLLRKRVIPTDSLTFHANLVFDTGIEVILESLVDIMCLHDHRQTVAQGNGGALETLFTTYDCNVKRSDVAVGLMVELCRCTGSKVDEEGDILEAPPMPSSSSDAAATPKNTGESGQATPVGPPGQKTLALPPGQFESATKLQLPIDPWRQVPPHLKELCAEAIMGGMKCLFRDDHASEQTRNERRMRDSIMEDRVEESAPPSLSELNMLDKARAAYHLRDIKSKKRLLRRAAQLFNKKSSKGIEFLVNSGIIADPVTPRSVASFLRNGIVVGLDKRAVGAYLGEVGKSPVAGKSPPNWERDWFHKEVLGTYCNLFRFERQSLLDGLRMFLAAFRLPGEAQQIDRILQAFSDSCGRICDEGPEGNSKVFSEDLKRASDAAYLLSFSIIMLNTDLHNDNIREDRKMSKQDFVKNNADYGQDITEKGKELPREYLESIYVSIREEEIRTEGEGADGSMTVERWKDVLRGSAGEEGSQDTLPSEHDAEDLTELVLEHVWMPIISAIGALWGVSRFNEESPANAAADLVPSGMLGAQGARLGMDMALGMLDGVRKLGRNDIFRKIFNCVCKYSGLLEFTSNAADRAWSFSNSVEAQSAAVVALQIARDASDEIGVDGWKRVWSVLFELRDQKMLGGGVASRGRSILMESDPDLLRDDARREWTMKLIKGGMEDDSQEYIESSGMASLFGSVGRALFGSVEDPPLDDFGTNERASRRVEVQHTIHGKEEQLVWDELAPSDDEDEEVRSTSEDSDVGFFIHADSRLSAGAKFESQLIHEDLLIHRQRETPVTGLERVDDTQRTTVSPRARVRKRLVRSCDFSGLVLESRFMDEEGIGNLLQALMDLIPVVPDLPLVENGDATASEASERPVHEIIPAKSEYPLSPASEGFAEVLICEVVVRNRDRLSMLWHKFLRSHYVARLQKFSKTYTENESSQLATINAGVEKCVTGLLRITCFAVQREDIANDVLGTWKLLDPSQEKDDKEMTRLAPLDRHIGEGLWRIARFVDGTTQLNNEGWDGLLALAHYCAHRGAQLPPIRSAGIGRSVGLAEDDPALQAYRSLHFMLNASEVKDRVPPPVVVGIRALVAAGERRNCPKLSIAGLDLLHAVNNQIESSALAREPNDQVDDEMRDLFWKTCWRPVVEGMAEASEICTYSVSDKYLHWTATLLTRSRTSNSLVPLVHLQSVRQHSLSMLTDAFLDKRGGLIPVHHLCSALGELCIPLAGRRVISLRENGANIENFDELMIELELCIGLIFKPLRHHLRNVANEDGVVLLSLWKPVLVVLKDMLRNPSTDTGSTTEGKRTMTSGRVLDATNELAIEHLRNVVMVLIGFGVLKAEPQAPDDISALTWDSVGKIDSCKSFLDEWKLAASSSQA
jgi:hypothetical protein